jgi:hypothetical protein
MTQVVASRVDAEIAILRSWKWMSVGYDETAKLVNKSYAETGDIRQTMRETRLPFDVVWEMVGFRDEMDWMDTQD